MVEEIIPIFGILFGIGGPAVVIIVWFSLNYHKRRKLMELHHAERMAAIERGMEIPPLPIELIDGRSTPKRRSTALLPGLVWFFIGLAFVVGALAGNDEDIPVFAGLIPLGIGLAYLIYYFVEGRKIEARWMEHDLSQRGNSRPANPV
ncbi:MAG TPA: DUF6249 domain-containing protein [Steroidobacteraceae bacterium]|jgi:uncharacterized protein DUF6249|nr:DUF6249 domain-containing protein [Steroidobacteraceae bacterium]HJY37108.1 DUF6249 domain-containing protein [Steroidobacteraceae bacterium]